MSADISAKDANQSPLARLLRWPWAARKESDASEHQIATNGALIYAIGDIHGRRDLLDLLLERITQDLIHREKQQCSLVFLGDYIDRGPDSKGVIETVLCLADLNDFDLVCLKGNHEQIMLNFLNDPSVGAAWMVHGGRDTLASYGVDAPSQSADEDQWLRARDALEKAVPKRHIAFLSGLATSYTAGSYFFAHAGVRPGVPLEDQEENDLMWIRKDFINFRQDFPKIVVHGHTPIEEASRFSSRIAIDTGAYLTGRLSAVRLENDTIEFLTT